MSKEVKPVVGVGAIVVHRSGAVLLGYRHKVGESPSWCLPGGHVDPGESFEESAIREVMEEAGIEAFDPKVLALAQRLDGPSPAITGAVVATPGQADVEPHVLEPHVFACWRWFKPDELPTPLFPASAAVLAIWRKETLPEGWRAYVVTAAAGDSK
ncbi:nucleotide triphosphate diphosphatase NUDT15 [Trinickia mobilis]|uniref:nucleotide triphosphate diphosphatase NUDT15 n=1 Tax=Trinickia mobilis TaxID=2816356 RepID=UPI001A8FC9CF|nr:NUDIX domain-containing protein [Trinickia mobilis]